MKTIDLFFVVTGYDANTPFIIKFRFSELQQNKGKHADTELFYTLQEMTESEFDPFISLSMTPITIGISRDNPLSKALIMRVPKEIFDKTTEQ